MASVASIGHMSSSLFYQTDDPEATVILGGFCHHRKIGDNLVVRPLPRCHQKRKIILGWLGSLPRRRAMVETIRCVFPFFAFGNPKKRNAEVMARLGLNKEHGNWEMSFDAPLLRLRLSCKDGTY